MDRDPYNFECTRDPIFLLQVATYQWTEIPDGLAYDGDGLYVEEYDLIEDWIKPFVSISIDNEGYDLNDSGEFINAAKENDNINNWPYIYEEWRTEAVYLTRDEAEEYGKTKEYQWDNWKVYCIPCNGELSKILNNYKPAKPGDES